MHEINLKDLISELVNEGKLSKAIISNRRTRDAEVPAKIVVRPFEARGELKYQFEKHFDKKVTHENLGKDESVEKIISLLEKEYKQGDFKTSDGEYQALANKKGIVRIKELSPKSYQVDLSHDRNKNYILKEGQPVDFLVKLGVMSPEGEVYKKKYDKFKQINKFLELVDDIADELDKSKVLNIVDFGCGKSYLTFALYHYLASIKNMKVNIIGMDLKKDVIDFCNKITKELTYSSLSFVCGDISDFRPASEVDMVVTLHACDNATDIAIANAARWGAKIILSVPCCQHELYGKVNNPDLSAMLKHGIIKERLSSLVTDSLRGSILEILGYRVQLLEFVDMEHTPKNIMIRAVRKNEAFNADHIREYNSLKKSFGLEKLFIEDYLGEDFRILEEG
jgi:SAM-dependent methyltransferase